MNGFVGFLLLAGIVVVVWLVQTGIGKSISAVDRTVRSGTLEAGRGEVHTKLAITAPVPPASMVSAIVKAVNARPSAPAAVEGIYLKKQTATLAQFGYGSALRGDHFDSAVQLSATPDGGCTGSYEVLRWQESGADVLGRREMRTIRDRVEQAARDVRGHVRVSGSD